MSWSFLLRVIPFHFYKKYLAYIYSMPQHILYSVKSHAISGKESDRSAAETV
jgi:hypothetical protein